MSLRQIYPLEDLKVLDLSRFLPGSYCTMVLADMGADVIKVEEAKRRWDPIESMHPDVQMEDERGFKERFRLHQFLGRNKKSMGLNLKEEKGRHIFYKLVETADVVVDEFRPGVTKRLGVDYETVSKINPRIVYCSITGYGQNGPYALLPGHDQNYLAVSGILGTTGTPDGQFVKPSVNIADLGGGAMQAIVGILLALLARDKSGKGQHIDISMLDGLVSWFAARHGSSYFVTGKGPKRGERPAHVYQTKDGKYICVAPLEPWFWERLLRALGLEKYIPCYKQHFGTYPPADTRIREEIIGQMAEAFRKKTRDEWFQILRDADTCVSPVYEDLDEVFSDPQILARDLIVEIDHPTLGKVKQIGISIKLSDTPGVIRSLPPQHGEHTEEILLGLGYIKKDIEDFQQAGIVK